MKRFLTEYPAVLALATDFITSVASAKTAGTTVVCIQDLFSALASIRSIVKATLRLEANATWRIVWGLSKSPLRDSFGMPVSVRFEETAPRCFPPLSGTDKHV